MTEIRKRLIVFARYPCPGKVKTRLIPALGADGAAALHRRLVLRTWRIAIKVCQEVGAELEVRFDGGTEHSMRHWLGDSASYVAQGQGDLGERMARAFDENLRGDSSAAVLIGSDCPALDPDTLVSAFRRLADAPIVIGPANDGGYYLVGMACPHPELFREIPWGTETVLADSLRVLKRLGVEPTLLKPLSDLDRPEDLPAWQRLVAAEHAHPEHVSVIIPALNEERQIVSTLRSVQQSRCQIIAVDGGSRDATVRLARAAGARILSSSPGRGRQMNAGAAQADGSILLFLHADTVLCPDWLEGILGSLREPGVAAGAYRFRLEGDFPGKSCVEWTTGLRSAWLQRPYGDQGLFLSRALFEEIGGFADLPIMEDYESVNRLRRRGQVRTVGQTAITSGRRWKTLGVFRTTLINQLVLAGYRLGVSPDKLARFYRAARQPGNEGHVAATCS